MREGWRRVTLGEVTQEQNLRVGDLSERVVVLSSTKHHGLVRSDEYFKNRQIYSDDISGYKLVRRGWFSYATNHLTEGSIGLQDLVDDGCVSPVYTVFSCSPEVDKGFMIRVLKSDRLLALYGLHDQASVDRRGAVRYSDFKDIEIDLPPLLEQRRIAEVLDEVDAQIQRLRSEDLKLGDLRESVLNAKLRGALEVLEATEVSHMAERVDQTMGCFRFVLLGSLLSAIDAGHSPDLEDKPAGAGQWGVLKVSAVGREGFRPLENKRVEAADLVDSSLEVRKGDLLMTRANTPGLVGLSCVVGEVRPGLMLSDKTLRLNLACRDDDPRFLDAILRQSALRRQIEIAATGTSNSMKNISQESIRKFVVPWADPSVQTSILAPVVSIQEKRDLLRREVVKLESVRKALVDDLFAGQVRIPTAL
ncbi:restriction endonuclease subunit S [Streptomyces sp. NPDC038707]|uniref:restriction endonuclease subunit S n=1 Tax=Streptomyces sp. NPDC038707 TaxID=3154329 RepID=UPI0033EFF171